MSQTLAPNHVPDSPTLPRIFMAATRAEWTKLRTVRSTMWSLIFTVVSTIGLGILLTALEVSRWDHRSAAEATGFDPLLYSFAGVNLAQLSIGVLGVLVMTSEYATGTIKLTFGATPQRRLLLAAKVTTFSSVVAAIGLVSCLSAFFVCQAILGPQHGGVSISDPGVLRAVIGGAAHLVLIAAIAVGVGAVLRRTAGAVAVLFAVLLVVPGLVALLPSPWNDDITRYLPSSAGVAMSAIVRFPNLLSPAGGFLVLSGYAAAILVLAAVLLVRRDA
ncbi:ABC transporter permease [Streptomyces phaeochromogenes]|uniref:ABC transporter permease n=1 Tax=Streptomyces phaeochromogenes TaxID=1923 RepID=UPI00386B97AD|nr:ABC transporter permease subunit [Streptomyces phaeochromogenes]WSW11873.1 ABC transporter permease subunit [Streptomyces phaeochromogenes]